MPVAKRKKQARDHAAHNQSALYTLLKHDAGQARINWVHLALTRFPKLWQMQQISKAA
jgi:hypothetical protein